MGVSFHNMYSTAVPAELAEFADKRIIIWIGEEGGRIISVNYVVKQ